MSSSNTPVAHTSLSHPPRVANGRAGLPPRLGLPLGPSIDPRVHDMVANGNGRIKDLKERLRRL